MSALDRETVKDIRRGILWCLRAVSGHKLNESVIRAELVNGGHSLPRAVVRDHLGYLAAPDKGYILLRYNEAADLFVAEITGKGIDLIDGCIFDPGVSEEA